MQNATEFIDSAIAEMHDREAALAMWTDAVEEMWFARLQEARCHWELGDDDRFLREALTSRNERPNRAEPLFDLARFHRERGMHEAAPDFAEAGLALECPGDDTNSSKILFTRQGSGKSCPSRPSAAGTSFAML